MYKLIILIEEITDEDAFNLHWPTFLHWAEDIPTLRGETTSRVHRTLFGAYPCSIVHELYFDSLEDAYQGLSSPPGKKAGQMLQLMTQGKVTLLLADHHHDSVENLQKYRKSSPRQETPDAG